MKKYFKSMFSSRYSVIGISVISVGLIVVISAFSCGRKPMEDSPSNSPEDHVGSTTHMNIKLQLVASGLQAPLYVAFPGNGNMLAVEQTGVIKLFKNGTVSSTPFLNIRSKLVKLSSDYDERGLLGLALSPNFKTNHKFYVYYSAPSHR